MNLYIDPGTGSMLFTILIGVIGAAVYSLRMFFIKLRMRISGGKVDMSNTKIPFVIFSDNKRYWNVFEPICREMDKRGKDIVYMTASPDDPALNCAYPHVKAQFIGEENKAFAKLHFLNASIVLSTTPGLDVYQWRRAKDVQYYVHILHAASDVTMYRMFGIDYYDAILLSGDYQGEDIRQLEKLRSLPEKELVKIGIPYMDDMMARLKAAGPAPEHPRTVLLAPTWGSSSLFNRYGAPLIEKLINTGYHIIIRPHPQSFISEKDLMDSLMRQFPESEQIEWNRDVDNFEVLRRSDILISDFSGVIFDFSLVFNKPIIYTDPKFDVGLYDAWWLDKPFWTISALPRLGCELKSDNMDQLKNMIDTCLSDPKYEEGRNHVREETWAYMGEGASRAVDYLLEKYEQLTQQKEEK